MEEKDKLRAEVDVADAGRGNNHRYLSVRIHTVRSELR